MMKKILLGTSAIVGASVLLASPVWAAEKPQIKMDGYLRFEAWGMDQDVAANRSLGTNDGFQFEMDDVEIHFQGSAKADNGLEYGFYVELQEGTADSTAGYDEANVYLSGNWGRLDLGSQDSIVNTWENGGYMVVADKDGAINGNNMFTVLGNRAPMVSGADFFGGDDANKITYYSPSFSGFQVGATFMPNSGKSMNSNSARTATTYEAATDRTQDYALGLKYKNTFNDVTIDITAGMERATYGLNDLDSTSEKEDVKAYRVGAKVSYMGFDLAGSYQDYGDSGLTKAQKTSGMDAGYWWDLGIAYTTGPYKVSAFYGSSAAAEATGTSDDKFSMLAFGANYAAAPGLDLYVEYQYVDLDQTGSTSDNTANLFLIGTQVSF